MNKALLISEQTLKKYTLINDNIDGMYILPTIQVCQEIDLDLLLGPVLREKLEALVHNNTISNPENAKYKELLDEYISPYMAWQVMSHIQISVNYKLSNSGVIENQDDKKSRLDYSSSRALQAQYEKYANSYAQKLTNYLIKNIQFFPEYRKIKNFESSEDPNLCGIFFPENINRKRYIGK